MRKKKLDSSNSLQESEASGLGLKIVEDFYKARKPREYKGEAPTLRSDRHGLLVSGQTKSTNTPVKSIEKGSEMKNSSKVISGKSPSQIYPTMTFSAVASLVKVFPLREGVRVFKTSQGELFSLKSVESLEVKDQATYSLRMLKDYFLTTQAEPSQLYSFHWMNLGTMSNGRCVTLSISFHKTGKGSLSSVLEDEVEEKYYLSDKMLEKIREKKDAHPDIKWKSGIRGEGRVQFPDDLNKSSRTITTAESGANRMTHGIMVIQKTGGQTVTVKYNETGTLQAGGSNVRDKTPNIIENRRIRRLTPIECERLQGFPDGWTEGVSDTQRYKMMGNAVSVPVITAIGKRILKSIK